MPVAIRTSTRLQDLDDINVALGVGVDEYALTYDHDTARFVLRAPAAPFAGILATGATVGATAQAQVFNYGIKANENRQAVAGLIARSGAWPTPSNILELYDHNNGLRAYMTSAGGLRLAAVGNTGPFAGIDTQGLAVGYFELGTVAARDLYKVNDTDLSLASSGATAVSLNCSNGVGSGGMKVGSGTGTTPVFSVSGAGVVTLTAGIRPAADSTTALQLQNAAGTSILNVDTTNARVGIGTTAPGNKFEVVDSVFPVLKGVRTSAATNTLLGALGIEHKTSDNMADGFGVGLFFNIQDNALATQAIGSIGAFRDGADTEGGIKILAGTNGLEEFVTLKSSGNVGIGTTTPATRLDIDAGALTMAEMTAPTGVANKAMLYTKDNGSGKTQLCVKLGDDVEIVIATQA